MEYLFLCFFFVTSIFYAWFLTCFSCEPLSKVIPTVTHDHITPSPGHSAALDATGEDIFSLNIHCGQLQL